MPFRRRLLGEVWLGQTSHRRKDVAKAPPQSLPADQSLGRRNSAKIRATTLFSGRWQTWICAQGYKHLPGRPGAPNDFVRHLRKHPKIDPEKQTA
ncbi:hypothetical protein [Stenotrophomonas indicatrix]|jgi:hypothetical protein|uniref:hypothetical protein n=1 Tax=Stenotrophomonas indicatrix TaxID=2045451 RepID=UPI000FDCC1F8|nr:hypothetical protein [Stenotrophomonas indicatrix]MCR8713373.1 hypothetical protein [Stenotrophomonas indicatrix]